jgi:hypothetical protein
MNEIPTEIQTTIYWKLIGHNATAQPPVLSPSSILSPPSFRCTFISAKKISVRLEKAII